MRFCFTVHDWSFWSPSLDNNPLGAAIKDTVTVATDNSPDIDFVPMMTRRRFSQLTKMFFYTGHKLISHEEQLPVFFISKYGEINRQYAISRKLLEDGEVLPTPFGFSVFNTAPALFAIFEKNHKSAIAINCCTDLLETGLVSVLAFLKKGVESKALLIIADEKPPDEYAPLTQTSYTSYAACFLIDYKKKDIVLELDSESKHSDDNEKIPAFFRFLLEKKNMELKLNGMRILKNV